MTHTTKAVRAGGAWLATASFLMIVALGFHGPIDADLGVQMEKIAGAAIRWSVVHWIAAAALSLYAVTGLVVLTSRSRLTDGLPTLTAWAVLTVGALLTVTTAVAETTVVPNAAASGINERFEAWWAFAEGNANGFAFVALAIAVIAGNEARASVGATPTWSAWMATAAGVASFTGWAVGMWFGVGLGNLLWVVALDRDERMDPLVWGSTDAIPGQRKLTLSIFVARRRIRSVIGRGASTGDGLGTWRRCRLRRWNVAPVPAAAMERGAGISGVMCKQPCPPTRRKACRRP